MANEYLPVPQEGTYNGAIYTTPLSNKPNTPYGNEKIYTEKLFENSPLDRVLEQKQVGTAWNDKPVKFEYGTNTATDVKKYVVTTSWTNGATTSSVPVVGNYGANQLYKTTVTDEDGNKTTEFKNAQGQVILVRKALSASQDADTYYVYNEYNQLALVIPPEAVISATMDATVLNNYCYQYNYDGRNRLVGKKLPGKGWEYMVYDKQDRLVMTQDAQMGLSKQWLFTKYDQFGRPVYTGIYTGTSLYSLAGRASEQTNVETKGSNNELRGSSSPDSSVISLNYNNAAYPTSGIKILTINYYDSFPRDPWFPNDLPNVILDQKVTITTQGPSVKGLLLASYVKNIENDDWTRNFMLYDPKARLIGSRSTNHLGGSTNVDLKLSFAGLTEQTITRHKRLSTDTEKVITEGFTYDHQNRPLLNKHQVDQNPVEILSQNKYNELSQLESKKVGGIIANSPLQQIDYEYNIRGWMTKINDPVNLNGKLFGYEIRYNNPVSSAIAPGKFNGNIAEVDWKNSTEDLLKRYNYEYDNLNRLKNAFYKEPTTGNSTTFDEYLTYDLNGNINTLKRNAPQVFSPTATTVDDLEYKYTGNRLNRVIENALNNTGYEGGNNFIDYDLNGNMTNMKDKGIEGIGYNHLNLADSYSITQKDPLGTNISFGLNYLYRADGSKVRKTYSSGGGRGQSITNKYTDYLDGFQYSFSETVAPCPWCRTSVAYEAEAFRDPGIFDPIPGTLDWQLDFVPTSEGFYSFTENRYIYQYRDHLGNARVNFAKNAAGALEVTDTNNYYAFGMNHIGGMKSLLGGYQNYKYNGKELQESGMYDYGARMYMPDLGRWGVVDPLAEKHPEMTPYRYSFNNPVNATDPTGLLEDWFNDENGDMVFKDSVKSQQDMDTQGIKGTYVGETDQQGDLTYAANGYVYDDSTAGGGLAVANGRETKIQEVVLQGSGSNLSKAWNSGLARTQISDYYTIGLSSNVAAFLGVGTTPINFTLLTRGKEPGLYFTPTINASLGDGIEGNAGVTVGRGIYTGNPRSITSSMLQGNSFGLSVGLGLAVDASVGASYAPTGQSKGFIGISGQVGVGVEGSPATLVNIQATYQYTPIVKPIFQFK
ncbi:RHS repeat-associated core domain-containing protein [Chryseobacterium polytrichastri]|uniref:RHS repeat-associated core domain-containing protein n=1 Tax=Chryseobacterium polytrichastri TaxID=1302687 RepID=A0A1M7KZQ0_9FLAO|nr:RHS repeat-associated core domain-containing protein [Chryseobacterium polytrichastri]